MREQLGKHHTEITRRPLTTSSACSSDLGPRDLHLLVYGFIQGQWSPGGALSLPLPLQCQGSVCGLQCCGTLPRETEVSDCLLGSKDLTPQRAPVKGGATVFNLLCLMFYCSCLRRYPTSRPCTPRLPCVFGELSVTFSFKSSGNTFLQDDTSESS